MGNQISTRTTGHIVQLWHVVKLKNRKKPTFTWHFRQQRDVLPRYTEQRSKAEIERESQEIIKRELELDAGFELLTSNGYTGFLELYLQEVGNEENLTTKAKPDIVKTLSEKDLLRDLK